MSADLVSNEDTEQVSAQHIWASNGGLAKLRGYSWAGLEALSHLEGLPSARSGCVLSAEL
jgi:hypothetical protein